MSEHPATATCDDTCPTWLHDRTICCHAHPTPAPRVDVDELGRLLAAATPGPWVQNPSPRHAMVRTTGLPDDLGDEIATTITAEDAALIAALVNAAPALLAEVSKLRATLARVEALADPAWRTNRGHEYDTTTEAFAAGRNDHIDRLRAALGGAS